MAELCDLMVSSLGQPRYDSPLAEFVADRRTNEHYVDEDDRVLLHDTVLLLTDQTGRPRSSRASNPAGRGAASSSRPAAPRSAWSPAEACARGSTTSSAVW